MQMFKRSLGALVLGVSLLSASTGFISVPTAMAQTEAGQIAGKVTDPTGALIAGGTVTVKNTATDATRTAKTSSAGTYLIAGLEPATYQVTVTSTSFQPFTANVEVTVGGTQTLDAQLSVTASTTEVSVIGEGGVQVNTQTQELSQVVDSQQLSQLPSLTRNPYDFVVLSGNVSAGDNTTNSMSSGQNLTTRGVGVAINGQRESGTEVLLDGVENVGVFDASVGEQIPLDAVQEYSIITNNFAAEYGRASGGVVNLTTKSGTNAFHGSAWEFNRLSAYTSNTYANDAANDAAGSITDPKGGYTRNQFGFAIGGPIKKDKLFFFGSNEWTRVRSSATEVQEVFDPAFIALLPTNAQAYLSTYGTGVKPSSGVATTAGQLASAQGGVTLGLVNGVTPIPASTPVFDTVSFQAPFDAGGDVPQNTYDLVARLDFQPTDKTQMFVRVGRQSLNEALGSAFFSAYPQYDAGSATTNQSFLYSISHAFSPGLFDNAKVSFTRFNTITSFNTALTSTPSLFLGATTDPNTNTEIQLPGLENTGDAGNGGLPFGGPQNTIQAQDDLTLIKGRHAVKVGGQFTYIQLNVAYGAYAQANEVLGTNLQNGFTDLLNTAGDAGGSTLQTFAARVNPQGKLPCSTDVYGNLIQTQACSVTTPLSPASYGRSYRYKDWAAYAQDSFKLTPRFTLNYGLRYEHYGVQHNNIAGLDSNFYYGSGSSLEQQVRNGSVQIADNSYDHGFWDNRWGTAAPRLGFAYDVFGNGKSSLRGGYGISYERNFGNVTYNASFNPPASSVVDLNCSPGSSTCANNITNNNLGALGVSGTTAYLPPAELRAPASNIQVASTQFWSLALQQQISHNTVFEMSYSGAHGVHLYDIENTNQLGAAQFYLGDALVTSDATSSPATTCGYENFDTGGAECLTRPNAQFAAINTRGSMGTSHYDALNLRLQSQNIRSSGVSLIVNYTYSHSLDDLSSTFGDSLQGGSGDVGSLGYTDLYNPMLDYGSSDYDIRNRLVISPIWSTPWFKGSHGFLGEVLGGYTVTTIYTARTGIPFSVYDYSTVEIGYTVPRLIPITPITQHSVAKNPAVIGTNSFSALTVPVPVNYNSLDPALGISDFGPFPITMTRRNTFRGPGAWNDDLSVSKGFRFTERFGGEFRAEGFDILNHHNYYVNTTNLLYDANAANPATPLAVTELRGGLGNLATGGNHDERRFGQFAFKLTF